MPRRNFFLFAADRSDPRLAQRYDWLSPAILRFLKRILDTARAAEVPVRICGEMAGRPLEAMALIGIGADSLARWHAKGGRYTVSLVVAHALLIIWGYAVTAHTNVVAQTTTLLHTRRLSGTWSCLICVFLSMTGRIRADCNRFQSRRRTQPGMLTPSA